MNNKLREYANGKSGASLSYDPEPLLMKLLEKSLGSENLERMYRDVYDPYDHRLSGFDPHSLSWLSSEEFETTLEPYTNDSKSLAKEVRAALHEDEWTRREAVLQAQSFQEKGYPNPL